MNIDDWTERELSELFHSLIVNHLSAGESEQEATERFRRGVEIIEQAKAIAQNVLNKPLKGEIKMARPVGKLGMKSFSKENVPNRLRAYLVEAKLPPLPVGPIGHAHNWPKSFWGMLGNDNYGDCVLAGAGHEHRYLHQITGKPPAVFTDKVIVDQYLHLTGGQDAGLDPTETAKYRVNPGLLDASGNRHKIQGFALIDTLEQLYYSIYLFGLGAVGVNFPSGDKWMKQFEDGVPWTDTTGEPDPSLGHYMPALSVNRNGMIVLSTWSDEQACSREWLERYWVGGLAYLSDDYLLATGKTLESINWSQLQVDMSTLSA